jgi:hypothetical protein
LRIAAVGLGARQLALSVGADLCRVDHVDRHPGGHQRFGQGFVIDPCRLHAYGRTWGVLIDPAPCPHKSSGGVWHLAQILALAVRLERRQIERTLRHINTYDLFTHHHRPVFNSNTDHQLAS